MPKPRTEEDKKHGDPLEPLIGRTGGAPGGERGQSARDEESDEDDPTLLQDDDDEDIQNDDDDSSRDVGDSH